MEIQLTDHENAAFAIFIVLLTRAILSYGLNLYIPISKVSDKKCNKTERGGPRWSNCPKKFHVALGGREYDNGTS